MFFFLQETKSALNLFTRIRWYFNLAANWKIAHCGNERHCMRYRTQNRIGRTVGTLPAGDHLLICYCHWEVAPSRLCYVSKYNLQTTLSSFFVILTICVHVIYVYSLLMLPFLLVTFLLFLYHFFLFFTYSLGGSLLVLVLLFLVKFSHPANFFLKQICENV